MKQVGPLQPGLQSPITFSAGKKLGQPTLRPVPPRTLQKDVFFGASPLPSGGPNKSAKPRKWPFYVSMAAALVGMQVLPGMLSSDGGTTPIPNQYSYSAAPGSVANGVPSKPADEAKAKFYQNGNRISGPDELYAIADGGNVAGVTLNLDPSSANLAYYQITLKDGTQLEMNMPAGKDDQVLVQTLKTKYKLDTTQIEATHSVLGSLFSTLLPILLMLGLFSFIGKRAMGSQTGALDKLTNHAFELSTGVDTRFSDVKGHPEVVDELREISRKTAKRAQDPTASRPPKGVLLYGPPGTGKTLMGRAVAGESGVPVIHLSGSKFVEMFVGVGAARVRQLFKLAKETAAQYGGCIIFIDEIDAIGKARAGNAPGASGGHDEREQTLNQLLAEMDGSQQDMKAGKGSENIVVIGTTNRMDVLDPALVRPGRFDKHIKVPNPRRWQDRLEIIQVHIDKKKVKLADAVDLKVVARHTRGMSGADLENIVKEAQEHAERKQRKVVEQNDLMDAVSRVKLGIARPSLGTDKGREQTGHHELGHAILGEAVGFPVEIISMIPRDEALAFVGVNSESELGEEMRTKEHMLKEVLLSIGGRAAEIARYGENNISTGAGGMGIGGDLAQVEHVFRALRTTSMLGIGTDNLMIEGSKLEGEDKKLYERFVGNAIQTGVNLLSQIPQEKRDELLQATMAHYQKTGQDLHGEDARKMLFDTLGKSVDWNVLAQMAQAFLNDPLAEQPATKAGGQKSA